MRRLTAFISGRVQKTGYRARVAMIANLLGITGYVNNLPDGMVKIVAEGEDSDLERFLKAANIRNTIIEVTDVQTEYSQATCEFRSFNKMVSEGETDERLDVAAEHLKQLIEINKEILIEIRAMKDEVKATREEVITTRNELASEIRATKDEVITTRNELASEIRATKEEVKSTKVEVRATCNELKEILTDIKDSQDATLDEIKDLRSALLESVEDRLERVEDDVSQIKTKVGL